MSFYGRMFLDPLTDGSRRCHRRPFHHQSGLHHRPNTFRHHRTHHHRAIRRRNSSRYRHHSNHRGLRHSRNPKAQNARRERDFQPGPDARRAPDSPSGQNPGNRNNTFGYLAEAVRFSPGNFHFHPTGGWTCSDSGDSRKRSALKAGNCSWPRVEIEERCHFRAASWPNASRHYYPGDWPRAGVAHAQRGPASGKYSLRGDK